MATRTWALVLLALLAATPVSGLEHIDNVYWYLDLPAAYPDRTVFVVAFDAEITPTDLSEGVTFTIVERDENDLLSAPIWHYVLDELGGLPASGSRVHVTVAFDFACDPDGRLLPLMTATWVNYCDADSTVGLSVQGAGNGYMGSGFPIEDYEFALLDEHGDRAATTTSENAFTPCVTAPVAVSGTEADALKRLAQIASKRRQASEKPGDSGSIGVYFDAAGTICSGTIEPGVPKKIYVIVKTRGVTDCGIAGAEFRFTGVPASWHLSPVVAPGIISFGNPLAEGTTLAMPCQQPNDDLVILYEVDVLASEVEADVSFKLEPHTNPVGGFDCPLLVLCDFPFFTQVCVESIACHFNPSSAKNCDGTVAVETQTWTRVKQLYR